MKKRKPRKARSTLLGRTFLALALVGVVSYWGLHLPPRANDSPPSIVESSRGHLCSDYPGWKWSRAEQACVGRDE